MTQIETTNGMNGYPSDLKNAVIGFETFEEAEAYAADNEMEVQMFYRRDGWQLWERKGAVYEAIKVRVEDFGDDYQALTEQDQEDFYEEWVKPAIDDCDSIDELKKVITDLEEIQDKLLLIDETQLVLVRGNQYEQTLDKFVMEYTYDVHHYVIGCI